MLLGNLNYQQIEVVGVTPLEDFGDSVSDYKQLNYETDIKANFSYFNLKFPRIIEALSTDLIAVTEISQGEWDLIYIDGGHDEETVLQDFTNSLRGLKPGGYLVMDDSSKYTTLSKYHAGFRGHAGPSRVFSKIACAEMDFILGVGHLNILKKRF
jgi:precorrin-6B methylase 2